MKSITKILTALLLFAAFFTITSCSDDDAVATNSKCINPPSWIWGEWQNEGTQVIYILNENYFAIDNSLGSRFSIIEGDECVTGLEISESTTSTMYEFTVTAQGATSSTSKFEKGDGSTFIYQIAGSSRGKLFKQ
jgi:hypothetical protein